MGDLFMVGMVHLDPLPGSPRYTGDFPQALEQAVADAAILQETGWDAALVENFGDAPFYADDVPDITVAAMTRAVAEVRQAVTIPVGVNALRNDAQAALAVAAACGVSFIRVNVLSGTMFTDQGIIEGKAAELSRLRRTLGAEVEFWADVFVKHAVPPPGLEIGAAAKDLWERAGADALIVSGPATGHPLNDQDIRQVRQALPQARLIAGSGVTPANIAALTPHIDGAIVGTALKQKNQPQNPINPTQAQAIIKATHPS